MNAQSLACSASSSRAAAVDTRAPAETTSSSAARAAKAISAARELLALQASDWAFMTSRELAAPYARERFAAHGQALARALAGGEQADGTGPRNLAVDADRDWLLAV